MSPSDSSEDEPDFLRLENVWWKSTEKEKREMLVTITREKTREGNREALVIK